jgi:diguanylate cyclase (GGDEF)-like protein
MAVGEALAHRAMMFAEIGRFHDAIDDARNAKEISTEHGMRGESALAIAAEAIATWGLSRDPAVRTLIDAALDAAEGLELQQYMGPVHELEVEVLSTLGLHVEARAALEQQLRAAQKRLNDSSLIRWEHVRLGADSLDVAVTSESDALTGLPNRQHLTHVLPEAVLRHSPVCIGVIDLDGFKRINDNHGYLLGDGVLQEVAAMLERVLRRGDTVVRLGGDEFVMLLRDTSPHDARIVFDRVRHLIAARTWHGIPADIRLTASVGLTVVSDAATTEELLASARSALLEAKTNGSDRTVLR